LEEAKRLMNYKENAFYFLAMGSFKDPRKNLKFLVRAFLEAMSEMRDSHLVIKADKNDPPIVHPSGRVHVIPAQLSSEVINALYRLSHSFVSVHHSEGWGLAISDAMLFRLPVVATGYSGNLDFMNEANSFLVVSSERNIASKDCFGLFTAQMKWAYPSSDSLIEKLEFVYHHYRRPEVQNRITYAAASIKRFSRAHVSDLVKSRISAIISKGRSIELKTGMR
jgi:glycosyltransferase involved in cell wall biosynthesis